jgi:autotransporter translocation and assembly factor TamB
VTVGGTLHEPRLGGTASLAQGSYASPLLTSAIRNGALQLAFADHTATVRTLHADLGGGSVDGTGAASIGDIRSAVSTLAFHIDTREQHVGLEVPRLFRGKIDGALSLRRDPGANVVVGGDLAFSHTRIPLSALLPSGNAKQPTAAALPLAFALRVAATTDDRVQSPNVDVGVTGDATVGGTLAHPTLAGAFTSTDGSLNLYRSFTLQRARVAFDPSAGIIPNVDAVATTHVPNPSTDVLLHAHGPATNLALDLSSRPQYDKAQIIGLLVNAQALGAVSGVAQTSPNLGNGSNALQGAALGFVDQQFTRSLFQPFSSSVGQSLGLSSFNVNAGLKGGFSASATRRLGEKLTVAFSQSSDPQTGQRQSTALAYNLSDAAAFQLTLFNAGTGPNTIGTQAPVAPSGPTNLQLQSLAPPPGSNGYVFSFVRKFP